MKLKINLLLMLAMIIYPITVSQASQELSKTPIKELTTFSDDYPEYTAILKAMTPDQKAAVKALTVYERDRAIDEAVKVVILEKEPEIEYWKTKAGQEEKARKEASRSKTGWKIAAIIATGLLSVKTITDL